MSVEITDISKNVPASFSKRLGKILEKSGVEGVFELTSDGAVICLREKEAAAENAGLPASPSQKIIRTQGYMETFHIFPRKIMHAGVFGVAVPVPAGIEASNEIPMPLRDRASLIIHCAKEALKPAP